MNKSSSAIPLTVDLWNDLRKRLLEFQTIPGWASEVFSMGLERAPRLPTRISRISASRPTIQAHDKTAYLAHLEQIRYGSDSSELEQRRKENIEALKRHPCDHILELQIVKTDGLFRSLFAADTHEVIHIEALPSHFVIFPKSQQIFYAWRWIVAAAIMIAIAAGLTFPTFGSAATAFATALIVYLALLWFFGTRFVIEGAILVLLGVVLCGLNNR